MAGLFDDLVSAVGAVQATTAPVATVAGTPIAPASTEDRLAAVEQFVVTWGPVIEKLAPLLEKLEAL